MLTSVARADLPSWMSIEIDASVLLAALGVSLVTGFLAGIAPAIKLGSRLGEDPQRVDARRGREDSSTRDCEASLVVSEIALALALSVGAALLVKSFHTMETDDLGFERGRMLTFRVRRSRGAPTRTRPTGRRTSIRKCLRKLRELPGVESATFNAGLPIIATREGYQTSFSKEGQTFAEHRENPNVFWQETHPSYFEVMGIPLYEGRAFTRARHGRRHSPSSSSTGTSPRPFGPVRARLANA